MIGSELGGRYEIVARIGGGGMAIVYKAYDTLLHRHVAVKVLREQFVHDEEFIQRFLREARSAASLSHPNVVSIYDVGQDDEIHYIVMELIEGSTLNDIIKDRAPLQPDEAVRIASQICDALDHAHQNGIIHRDIKPHNILISKNGRIKVTDFGIARAVTSSDITQTGAVLGSVHYFSPEHAKGVQQGEKSDIYSLGAVIYQMVTNRLPFAGDSPISVALKHLQENIEEPRSINPLIPQSLENIILKAMRKDPEERYATARDMMNDLETCLSPDRINEAKLNYDDAEDLEKTLIMPAIRGAGSDVETRQETRQEEQTMQVRGKIAKELEDKPKRRRWIKPTVWAVIVVALFFGTWQGVKAVLNMLDVPEVTVPNVVGVPYEEAYDILTELMFEVQLTDSEYSNEYAEGYVVRQNKSEIQAKQGSIIQLTISLGPEEVPMPALTAKTENEARNALVEMGFDSNQIEIVESFDDRPQGTVVDQEPEANTLVNPRQDKVTLVISQGPGTENMPNLVGDRLEVALSKLKRINRDDAVKIEEQPDYTQSPGHVFRQWPFEPNDPVPPGAEITLYVSTGLPSDAIQFEKLVPVSPVTNGVASTIEIYVSDASGDNELWGIREISQPTSYRVSVIVSPSSNASIVINRDGTWFDTVYVTYAEARHAQGGGIVEPPERGDEEDAEDAEAFAEEETEIGEPLPEDGSGEHPI